MNGASWDQGTVLILGARGMLGSELVRQTRVRLERGGGRTVAWDLDELDIRDPARVRTRLGAMRPRIVINAAAYTNVDGCETNVDEAMAVNAAAPGHLGDACRAGDALLVQFSTDFVFDGRATEPYAVDAPTHPLSVYGRSKWEGEQGVRASRCRHLILRTSWLFGAGGHNFVEAILARAEAGEPLRVVTDQVGRPTHTVDLAMAVIRLLDASADGTHHFANAGQCSWHEFAREIVRQAGFTCEVATLTSAELNRPAARPAYSVLDTSGYTALTGHRPAPWQEALGRYLASRDTRR